MWPGIGEEPESEPATLLRKTNQTNKQINFTKLLLTAKAQQYLPFLGGSLNFRVAD